MSINISSLDTVMPKQQTSVLPENSIYELVQARHGLFLANKNDVYIGRALIHYGEYSEREWLLLEQLIPEGGVVVEVGAHMGALTVPICKKVGPKGIVCAFEPQPILFQNLCANLSLNGLFNAYAFNKACGQAEKTLKIPNIDYTKEQNFGSIRMEWFEEFDQGQDVEIVPLDRYEIGRMNLLKIDVEGMEFDVLQGAVETIKRCRPAIYAESHYGESAKPVLEFLLDMGYNIWRHSITIYEDDNYFNNTHNIYGVEGSINVLCLPDNLDINVGLPRVKTIEDLDSQK